MLKETKIRSANEIFYATCKKDLKRAVAGTKSGTKNIADQLKQIRNFEIFVSNGNHQNIVGMQCIRGKDGNTKVRVRLKEKMEVRKENENKQLNAKNECSEELNVEKNKGPYEK